MTEDQIPDPISDAAVPEDQNDDDTPTFRVVTHKTGLVRFFEPYGAQSDLGVSVDSDKAATDLWWMPQDWAIQVLNAGIELPQLLAPTPGWLAGLPVEFKNREIGTLLKRDIPRFFRKHPEYLEKHPQVVLSVPGEHTELVTPRVVVSEHLAEGVVPGFESMPDDVLFQLDEMLPCVVEVRCWVADKTVATAAPYRIGVVGWDSALFLEMLFNAEGQELQRQAVEFAQKLAAETEAPPGYVIDVGVTLDGTCTALRAWPAWAVEPLSADPAGVFAALVAAHDFDQNHPDWRWTPDRRVYERPASFQPENETESEEPTGVQD